MESLLPYTVAYNWIGLLYVCLFPLAPELQGESFCMAESDKTKAGVPGSFITRPKLLQMASLFFH